LIQDNAITRGGRAGRPFVVFGAARERVTMHASDTSPLSQVIRRGIACRCPRCGKGALFSGFLSLRPSCSECGLDNGFIDAGDGPAVFIILIAGFIVVFAALIVEFKYRPPYWLHAMLWLPLILFTTLAPLRSMKGVLIALQYHHKAQEGRLVERDGP
jgi:uncharacterized protein (DUF983 family)